MAPATSTRGIVRECRRPAPAPLPRSGWRQRGAGRAALRVAGSEGRAGASRGGAEVPRPRASQGGQEGRTRAEPVAGVPRGGPRHRGETQAAQSAPTNGRCVEVRGPHRRRQAQVPGVGRPVDGPPAGAHIVEEQRSTGVDKLTYVEMRKNSAFSGWMRHNRNASDPAEASVRPAPGFSRAVPRL